MYVCMCVCVYVCVYVCMYVCMQGVRRRGLGPRNDVLTTCKAVTLRGGQRVIGDFPTLNILIEATSEPEPAEEMVKRLKK